MRDTRRGLVVDLTHDLGDLPSPESLARTGRGPIVIVFGPEAAPLSATLEWVEQAFCLAEARGRPFRVVAGPDSKGRRVLELLRFDRFMLIAPNLRAALRK